MNGKHTINTIKDLKELCKHYDDNTEVVIQMIDGEYDAIGYIDSVSDVNSDDFYREHLNNDTAIILRCSKSCIYSYY